MIPKFLIGYEIGTGQPVEANLHHLAIFGVTQHSGKTTSLEAFMHRIGFRSLVFRTGRGEIGFDGAKRILPFYREHIDWRFLEGLLSAHLQEKAKSYRADLMLAVRGAKTKTLEGVHEYVRGRIKKTREGSWPHKMAVEIDQYLSEVIPVIRSLRLAPDLSMGPGVNMIDLEGIPLASQQLIISSCLDRVMDMGKRGVPGTIVVVPEAWRMVPQEGRSPVKMAAEGVIREGAKIGNYLWLDSQQMTGLDMGILRNIDIWIFGRQALDLEKERVAKMIPGRKVSADDIHGLMVGQFYVVQYGERIQRVYVQPDWLAGDEARDVAMGNRPVPERPAGEAAPLVLMGDVGHRFHVEHEISEGGEETESWYTNQEAMATDQKEREEYESKIMELSKANIRLEDKLGEATGRIDMLSRQINALASQTVSEDDKDDFLNEQSATLSGPPASDPEAKLGEAMGLPAEGEKKRYHMDLKVGIPSMTVKEEIIHIRADVGTEPRGKLALLIIEGFFDQGKSIPDVIREFQKRTWGSFSGGGGKASMTKHVKDISSMGFLTFDGRVWTVTPGVKTRITRQRTRVNE